MGDERPLGHLDLPEHYRRRITALQARLVYDQLFTIDDLAERRRAYGGLLDQRADGHAVIETRAHGQLFHLRLELFGEGLGDTFLHIDAVGADAGLAHVPELGRDRSRYRRLEVRVRQRYPLRLPFHRAFYRDLEDPVAFLKDAEDTELARFWPYVFGAAGDVEPEVARTYSDLMADSQGLVAEETLRHVSVGRTKRLMDLGGGSGAFLAAALTRYPDLEAVLFEKRAEHDRRKPASREGGIGPTLAPRNSRQPGGLELAVGGQQRLKSLRALWGSPPWPW